MNTGMTETQNDSEIINEKRMFFAQIKIYFGTFTLQKTQTYTAKEKKEKEQIRFHSHLS